MAKIEIKHPISGTRNGKQWPKPGETIDVPTKEAERLVRQGAAVKPEAAKKATGSS